VVLPGTTTHSAVFFLTSSVVWRCYVRMTKCETKVTNGSGSKVVLKLSNGGTHVILKEIEDRQWHTIGTEPNATYREYWVGSIEGTPILFSSDDCLGNKEIKIQNGGKVEMIPRIPNQDTSVHTVGASSEHTVGASSTCNLL
jgi:hypothetical protein